MNEALYDAFQKTIADDVYVGEAQGHYVIQRINEEDYQLELKYKVQKEYGVSFRLEDFKEVARYLKGGKRAAGTDNDCTMIDGAIFQIEIKRAKSMTHHPVEKQFAGGKQWLNHIFSLVAARDNDVLADVSLPIYHLVIQLGNRRPDLTRNMRVKNDGRHFRTVIRSEDKYVDLSRVMRVLLAKEKCNDVLKIE
ncbi:hypothetical protein [Levilactobacillus fujinensis]|uniref:Restriction endonuclease n=1 Tax=Levilactobacillus fujinensis TaxID=2486024 RepID=A0ABW1TDL4_9LACO|nr:hypothetical protein [Levilactobacillus fujinensis]